MEEQNFLGQGMSALVPPRSQSSNQSIKTIAFLVIAILKK